ncbi:MAG: extracellular solute-binding protein [Eubacterium sp.]|nr:extracellular solute-binding protein [Eubacterium sp.]
MKYKKAAITILLLTSILFNISCTRQISVDRVSSQNSSNDKLVLKWMIYGEKSKNSESVFFEFNKRLRQYYPDTSIEFDIVPIELYKEKWDMKMATNEHLDLAWIGNDIFNYTEEVKKGSFMALDYLLSTYGQELLAVIPDNIWRIQNREGKTYSIPLLGMLYRKDYAIVTGKGYTDSYEAVNEIGRVNRASYYSNEQCYEVFDKYLSQLKAKKNLGTGISSETIGKLADKGYEGIYGPDSPFVIKIFDKDLQVYNKYELESYKLFFKAAHEWYRKGFIRENIEEVLNPKSYDGKRNGSALFLDEYGEHGVVTDKISTEYEAVYEPLQDYKYISYEACRNAVVLPRTTKNPQRALEIVNLVNTDRGNELYKLLVNGFEGRHYVKKGNKLVDKVTDETGKPLYNLSQYTLGNVFMNYESTPGEFDQLEQYNKNALVSPLLGFELDTRMIVLEMSKIDLVVDEYINTLRLGISEDWETVYYEFINKMKQAGSEKIISEMQKQIDSFRKTKDTKIG